MNDFEIDGTLPAFTFEELGKDIEMSYKKELSLEERVAALEVALVERDTAIAFMATLNGRLAEVFLGVTPFSDCEVACLKIEDTQARLNCMLKCIADGK